MVSIIITTKNEEKNIGQCLQSIKSQDYKDLEVIVVDNPRTKDRTREIVKPFNFPVFVAGPERSEQRNFGIKNSSGNYLLFIDADMRLSARVVSACVDEAPHGSEAIVIPEISVGEGFWAQCRSLEKKLYFNDRFIEAPRFFRREIFNKVGGYSSGLVSGEDWDLRNKVVRVGGKIGRVEAIIYHDEGRLTLKSALYKKFYYGQHSRPYFRRNPQSLRSVLRFFWRPSFLRNWKYVLLDPLHFLGLLILKFLEFSVGFMGVVFAKEL